MIRPLSLILALLLPLAARAKEPEHVPGELIVKWRNQGSRFPLSRLAGRRVTLARGIDESTWVYQLEERSARATRDALLTLKGLPGVEYAEPNFIRRPFATPNDKNFQYQWGLKIAGLERAWDRSKGSSKVVVAVVDTGILWAHPDLAGRLLGGYDFVSDVTNANDGNGWDADARDAGTETKDSSAFHGTHVAGIIGALSNNSTGITGVDWSCMVLPVRALGVKKGEGTDADIAAAIRWAAGLTVSGVPRNKHPAKVINLSFGGPGASTTLTHAVQAAQAAGAIVVAAAGNDGVEGSNTYPAAIKDVITVGAVQLDLRRAPYSNYGPVVDIMAPGGNMSQSLPLTLKCDGKPCPAGILGTLYDTKTRTFVYRFYDGTSQAAPLVSGVAALMLSINPTLNTSETLKILRKTANPSYKCKEGCGAGLVNAAAALVATAGSPINPTSPSTKLPYNYSCSSDSQCDHGICRNVNGVGKICTLNCTLDKDCPAGSTCRSSLCAPSTGPQLRSPGQGSCSGTNCDIGEQSIEGIGFGGCSLSGPGRPAALVSAAFALLLLLPLLLWLHRRRAASGPGHASRQRGALRKGKHPLC